LTAHYAQFKDNWCMPGNFSIFSRLYDSLWQKESSNLSHEQKKIG
jgi:hypothetical protein